MIRVAIFEDNKHLRETFELLLNNTDGFACSGAWPDCRNIITNLEVYPSDIVLMDIEMPGMNGIEATKLVKQHFPKINILIQTVFFEDEYIFNAICAGASGYILKSTTPDGYIEALKDVQAGGSPMTPGIARRVLELFKSNLQPANPEQDYDLTSQEKKVLKLLVEGKSYKLIAQELFVSVDTIKTHIRNIYAKLQVHSGTEAVSLALRDKLV
ncbi:MAG: response regulator transcription factor [Chitinophagaceae bacterium]|nr:response regulator transcription factor [Chitinophagaceae bacterium]MBK7679958.1 response regulator transcription factor [Chitinophagaceae bacterium]MBK9660594.1 response regulator transcription factor [Chitinophagaceae bacterium]MBL0068708.1 response regulator transcription factor [Chitinophagaceae bacterium]MBP6233472.1 response regulator transcription factor [Chitinophagaceae bacterium]